MPLENCTSAVEMEPRGGCATERIVYKGTEGQVGVFHLPFFMNECTVSSVWLKECSTLIKRYGANLKQPIENYTQEMMYKCGI